MPCGFPESGVGPLAPAKIAYKIVSVPEFGDIVLENATVYDLNEFEIVTVKSNIILSTIKFVLLWPEISATGGYSLQPLLKNLDLPIDPNASGNGIFSIQNLNIDVKIKYQLNIFNNIMQLKSLKVTIFLGGCQSDISGLSADETENQALNEEICIKVLSGINDNKQQITTTIEDNLKPMANEYLSQHKINDLLQSGNNRPPCVPPTY